MICQINKHLTVLCILSLKCAYIQIDVIMVIWIEQPLDMPEGCLRWVTDVLVFAHLMHPQVPA